MKSQEVSTLKGRSTYRRTAECQENGILQQAASWVGVATSISDLQKLFLKVFQGQSAKILSLAKLLPSMEIRCRVQVRDVLYFWQSLSKYTVCENSCRLCNYQDSTTRGLPCTRNQAKVLEPCPTSLTILAHEQDAHLPYFYLAMFYITTCLGGPSFWKSVQE